MRGTKVFGIFYSWWDLTTIAGLFIAAAIWWAVAPPEGDPALWPHTTQTQEQETP